MAESFLSPLLRHPDAPWALINQRTGQPLATALEAAFDSRTRNRGLLGRDGLAADAAMILAPCNAVHTFFMRFPIDILFVDRRGLVTAVAPDVAPWRLRLSMRAFATIEFPSGTLAQRETRRSDVLALTRL